MALGGKGGAVQRHRSGSGVAATGRGGQLCCAGGYSAGRSLLLWRLAGWYAERLFNEYGFSPSAMYL